MPPLLLASLPLGSLQRPRNCRMKPPFEVMLNAIVAGLLGEGAVPNGSIVDAGAQYGRWACYYAAVAPGRLVHAIDPNADYVAHMRKRYTLRRLPNLRPLHGGLSKDSAPVYDAGAAKAGSAVRVLSACR